MQTLVRIGAGLVFLGLILAVVFGGHLYVANGLVLAAGLPSAIEQGLVGIIVAGALFVLLQPIAERTLKPPLSRFIAWPAAIWMGVFFLSFVGLALSDLALLVLRVSTAFAADADPMPPAAVAPLRAAFVGGGVLIACAVALRGGLSAPRDKRVEITLERWPRERDGYRIVQISDIHIGPILGRRFATELVRRVNALEPDLVAVTGDLVDGSVAKLASEVAPFGEMRAPDGVFFVTGNHDHYSGARDLAASVERLGIRPLRNQRVTIGEGAGAFELAGVDDHRGDMLPGGEGGEDLDAALAGAPPDRALLLLAHDPSTFKRAHARGIDLQLSGHTHGGQLWPFKYFVRLAIPFVAGLYQRGTAQLYVSCGTGFWGPPMRLGAPAEVSEIVLRSGRGEARE